MDAPIVVKVERYRCCGNARLGHASVVSGEPHVIAFHTAKSFAALAASLAEDGYEFEVKVEDREVSMIEWYALGSGGESAGV